MKYAIVVDFRLHPGGASEFLPLIDKNASLSLHNEPGCERFDVLTSQADQDRVVLYEIYTDRAAFDEHCLSEHFREFDRAAQVLVQDKQVIEFDLRSPWHG